ncbi:MAG: DUF2066 domain-containing protein [Hyphomonadaceae bacterium]|nr:DUF2066 domain-containing protein [Hyphomonadaceae bacterium]
MKAFAGIAGFLIAALCALAPAPASAQGQGASQGRGSNVYAVTGVRVDATADNAAAAQTQAFAAGQAVALDRLIRRLTLPDDLARLGAPRPDPATVERMVQSIDVQEERRSGTRYVGRIGVRFQPAAVQSLLRGAGFSIVDSRGPPVLIVPLWTNVTQEAADAWRGAWENGGYGEELVPLYVAPRSLVGAPDWGAAQAVAQPLGAPSAIYLDLRVEGGTVSARIAEVGQGAPGQDRGVVQARLGQGPEGLAAGMQSLADQVSERLQNEWKVRMATNSGQRARVSASALFNNQAEWQRIKSGLERAASSLISEIRIEAVAREGALVSFSFVGSRQQLGADLTRYGIQVQETQAGPVLRSVPLP